MPRRLTVEAIVSALGLAVSDLMPQQGGPTPKVKFGSNRKGNATTPRGPVYQTAKAAVVALEKHRGPRSGLWTYHDAGGEPVGLVVRWDGPAGKDILPICRFPDGWRVAGMPAPRPLYHLPQLSSADRVLVVEGEKAADAARSTRAAGRTFRTG